MLALRFGEGALVSRGCRQSRLVGESRLGLVDGLVDVFEGVVADGVARWVSLEAPPARGKTRVGHEFYSRLAATQPWPEYWPARIVDPVLGRMAVAPVGLSRPAGSLPAFLWWGIGCTTHHGSDSDGWQSELRNLGKHAAFVDAGRRAVVSVAGVAAPQRGRL